MSVRDEVESRFNVEGSPVIIKLINNPTIDDIINTEARVQASGFETGRDLSTRVVSRTLRDYLIRLGIEL
jgi:hypothetical protein